MPQSRDAAADVLSRSRSGLVPLDEVSRVLSELEGMHLLLDQADVVRMLDELDQKVERDGIGSAKWSDAAPPDIVGSVAEDGSFYPRVFTSAERLAEFATANGVVEPGQAVMSSSRSWSSGLLEFLSRGYGGVVVDPGTEHEATFDRNGLSQLVAQLTLAGFATLEQVWVLAVRKNVCFQEGEEAPGRKGLWAYAFDRREAAEAGLAKLRQQDPGFEVVPSPPESFLRGVLGRETTRVFVNPSLADERSYSRADLERMLEMTEAATPAQAEANALPGPPPHPETPRWNAARHEPAQPPFARPGRDDVASRARFLEIKRMGDVGAAPWELSTALAFDLDLYAPVFPKPIEGRPWPMLYSDQDQRTGRPVSITHLFTSEARVRAELARHPDVDSLRHEALSGVEAARWIWSCPQPIVEAFIDHGEDDGHVCLPRSWFLPMLFPTFLGIPSLDAVPEVPVASLGELPDIGGLDPRVLRALLQAKEQLLGPPADASVDYPAIEHAGGRYLPVYRDPGSYFAFSSTHEGAPTPEGAGDEGPFATWLARAADVDGVVLDPSDARPLTLDRSDLLFLHLWTQRGRAPKGTEVVSTLEQLVADGRLRTPGVAEVVADWPAFFFATVLVNGQPSGIFVPGTDDLAVFSDEQQLTAYAESYRASGQIRGEVTAQQILPRWNASVFHLANEAFSGVRIDPEPQVDASGLHLDRAALDLVLARLERRLRPRVTGF